MNDTINQVGAGAPAAWTKTKPTAPGAYWIRGEGEGMLARTALVEVVNLEGELWCNLHMRNTDPEFGYGYTVAQLDEAFEWLGPLSPAAPAVESATELRAEAEAFVARMRRGAKSDRAAERELEARDADEAQSCAVQAGIQEDAAAMVEQLLAATAAPVVQADVQPVAWQARHTDDGVWMPCGQHYHDQIQADPQRFVGIESRPLYAAPPAQPDAALVEALAASLDECIKEWDGELDSKRCIDFIGRAREALAAYRAALAGKGGE